MIAWLLSVVVAAIVLVAAGVLLFIVWLRWKIGRVARDAMAQAAREAAVVEEADWFGQTGLDDDTERELPRYLRRELGQSVHDADALRAGQLRYLGVFAVQEDHGQAAKVHFWHMPHGRDTNVFAYVEVGSDDAGESMGWGDREPPVVPRLA